MRTKALLGLAALAASVFVASAQTPVYSLNVVGYYNITVPANSYMMIANQLNTTNNTIASLLPSVPPGTQIYKYSGTYTTYTFDEFDLAWVPDGAATLNPGEGAFFRNNSTTNLTLTFVGEVMQGNLTNNIPAGYAIRASMVPQGGTLGGQLGFPGVPGDQINIYSGTYTTYTFDEFDLAWLPSDPTVSVGQAFFSRKNSATQWIRNFTVN